MPDEEKQPEEELDEEVAKLLQELSTENTEEEEEPKQEGGETPPAGEDVAQTSQPQAPPSPQIDLSSPDIWRAFDAYYAAKRQQEELQRAQQERLQRLEQLVKEGKYEELGQEAAQAYERAKLQNEVQAKVVQDYLTRIYTHVLSDPIFANLSAEEKLALDPSRYQGDLEYLDALIQTRERKRAEALLAQELDKRVEERLKAVLSEKRGDVLRAPSASAIPGATPAEGVQGGDLLETGLRQAYEEWKRSGKPLEY